MTFHPNWAPTSTNQVIGESHADGAFIRAVAKAHDVPPFDFTAPEGRDSRALGKDAFTKHLNGLRTFVDRELVSRVVVVGDNDGAHALSDVRKAIQEAGGYPTPAMAPLEIAAKGNFRIGVIMIPGSTETGCLESLLLKATRTSGPDADCLQAWVECSGFPADPKNNFDKFRVRSILAATIKSEPNITLQRMWEKPDNPIKATDAAFKWIADFLRAVFS